MQRTTFIFLAASAAACTAILGIEDVTLDTDAGDAAVDVGTDTFSPPKDAASDADAGPPPPCNLSKPFATATLVGGLNTTTSDVSQQLSPDELTVVFQSNRGTSNDIYIATRAKLGDAFGTPTALTTINTTVADNDPTLSPDALQIYWASLRNDAGAGNYNLYTAKRDAATLAFAGITTLTTLNSTSGDFTPHATSDGKALFFASAKSGVDRVYSSAIAGSTFGSPVIVDLGTTTNDRAPALTGDGLSLYFSSDRVGGAGGLDIWVARRKTIGDPFATFTNITEVNTAGPEVQPWISLDECRLYFGAQRATDAGGLGSYDIWVAERPKN